MTQKHDYKAIYNEYWKQDDRHEHMSCDLKHLASIFVRFGAHGNFLDVGCGEGWLVCEMQKLGVDAFGIDISDTALTVASPKLPHHFFDGSVTSLPFADHSYDTVVSTDCLEHLAQEDVFLALKEIHRVTRRYAILQVATTPDRENRFHLTVQKRKWWEQACFEAGFRKHPNYYEMLPLHKLNLDEWQILIPLEKKHSSDTGLNQNDSMRDSSVRSDQICYSYQMASQYIVEKDSVLVWRGYYGFGAYILQQNSKAAQVTVFDDSADSVEYARNTYGSSGMHFVRGQCLPFLRKLQTNSFDVLVCLESDVSADRKILSEFQRILNPGGRIIMSAAVEKGQSGTDELKSLFLLEKYFAVASPASEKRKIEPANPDDFPSWGTHCIVVAMKDPLKGKNTRYEEKRWNLPETAKFNVAAFARDYLNPFLLRGMVTIGIRMSNPYVLQNIQKNVLLSYPEDSVDYGAALCGAIYSEISLKNNLIDVNSLIMKAEQYALNKNALPHNLRWQVSCLFAAGLLASEQGQKQKAEELWRSCLLYDVAKFSPLLGTKILDAAFLLALSYMEKHDFVHAEEQLLFSLKETERLTKYDWLNVRGNIDSPLAFGYAELAQLLDKASRAAYLLRAIRSYPERDRLVREDSYGFLERQIVTKDALLYDFRSNVETTASECRGLYQQNQNLVNEAHGLYRKNVELANENQQLDAQNQELVKAKAAIQSMNEQLSGELQDLYRKSLELEDEKQQLSTQNQELVKAKTAIQSANEQLSIEVQGLYRKSLELENENQQLSTQNQELVKSKATIQNANEQLSIEVQGLYRKSLELENENQNLDTQNQELVKAKAAIQSANEQLSEELQDLHRKNVELANKNRQLDTQNQELAKTKTAIQSANEQLSEELQDLHRKNIELANENRQLDAQNQELVKSKTAIQSMNEQLSGELQSLHHKSLELEDENQHLSTRNQELVKSKAAIQNANEQLSGELQSLHHKSLELENEKQQLSTQNQELVKAKTAIQEENNHLKIVVDDLISQKANLESSEQESLRQMKQQRELFLNRINEFILLMQTNTATISMRVAKVLQVIRNAETLGYRSRFHVLKDIVFSFLGKRPLAPGFGLLKTTQDFWIDAWQQYENLSCGKLLLEKIDIVLQVDDFLDGGLENVVIDQADFFQRNGRKVIILVLRRSGNSVLLARQRNINVLCRSYSDDSYEQIMRQLSPDAVIAHCSYSGNAICAKLQILFIQVVHNTYIWTRLYPECKTPIVDAMSRTTAFVCVSEQAKRFFIDEYGADERKTLVIPNGIDLDKFSFSPEGRKKIRSQYGIRTNNILFLAAGSIGEQKNYPALIRAMCHVKTLCPRAKLLIIGCIYDQNIYQEILNIAETHQVASDFTYAGLVENTQDYYSAADIFVQSSFYEGCSLTILESLACQCPFVASRTGTLASLSGMIPGCRTVDAQISISELTPARLREKSEKFDTELADAMIDAYNECQHRRLALPDEFRNLLGRDFAFEQYLKLISSLKKGQSVEYFRSTMSKSWVNYVEEYFHS